MEEKFGLITGIECRYVKTDPEIIEALAKKTGIDPMKVKSMMRYNNFTPSQFSELSKLAISTVTNKTRPSIVDKATGKLGIELDYCYPFQGKDSEGPKFILRNEKSEKYLR
jgi:hypothetical protein